MLLKINDFMAQVEAKNPNEPEFIQAVREFAETVIPFISEQKKDATTDIFLLRLAGIEPAASESESDVLSIKLQPHILSYLFHKQPIYHSR